MRHRLWLWALVATSSIALVLSKAASEPPRTLGPVSKGPDDWRLLLDEDQREASFEAIEQAIEARRAELTEPGPDSRGAVDDCLVLLRAWTEDDMERVLESRLERGMTFRRDTAVRQCRKVVEWKFSDPRPEPWYDDATDAEIVRELAAAQRTSGLEVDAVDVGAVRVAYGVNPRIRNEAEWPYVGTQGSVSLFLGPRGVRNDWPELEDGPETVHIMLRVRLRDGRPALVRFNYIWDGEMDGWVPVIVHVGADSGQYWPWPFAN